MLPHPKLIFFFYMIITSLLRRTCWYTPMNPWVYLYPQKTHHCHEGSAEQGVGNGGHGPSLLPPINVFLPYNPQIPHILYVLKNTTPVNHKYHTHNGMSRVHTGVGMGWPVLHPKWISMKLKITVAPINSCLYIVGYMRLPPCSYAGIVSCIVKLSIPPQLQDTGEGVVVGWWIMASVRQLLTYWKLLRHYILMTSCSGWSVITDPQWMAWVHWFFPVDIHCQVWVSILTPLPLCVPAWQLGKFR